MTLPNFLIIGAQKAGTSWLAYHLEKHPEIYLPKREIHYFDKGFNYEKGLSWYKQQFNAVTSEKAIGEKTPEYLWANGIGWEDHLSDVHQRLYQTLPNAKLIITLRNPVDRAVSAINHIIRSGRISPLHNVNELLIGKKQDLVKGYGILEKGLYYRQLSEYINLFGRENIMILIFEEMISEPQKTIDLVCDYLKVNPYQLTENENEKVNQSKFSRTKVAIDYHFPRLQGVTKRYQDLFQTGKIKPNPLTLKALANFYNEENQKLFQLLGHEIKSWESKY